MDGPEVASPTVVPESHKAEHALHHALSMTKDLEELMENVNIAEEITRRPSTSTIASNNSDRSIASVFSPRSNRIIEPIPALSRTKKSSPTLSGTSAHSLDALKQNVTEFNGVIEKEAASSKNRRLSSNTSSYRTRGSLTTSEEDEAEGTSPQVAAGSYSATGALVTSFATQTPEELDSSDSEQAPTEPETSHQGGPSKNRSASSTSSSTSSEEEWDSEADTHTSVSDEEEGPASKKRASTATYYQVVDTKAASFLKAASSGGGKGRQSRSPVPVANANQQVPPVLPASHPQRQPWLDRLQQGRIPYPSPPPHLPPLPGIPRPRPPGLARTQSALSSSRSFPQGFLPTAMPLSNPFFSTSLQEAYRQACAFKLWYEDHFPEQVGPGSNNGLNAVTRRANSSANSTSASGVPHGAPSGVSSLSSAQLANTAQPNTQRLYSR